MKTRLFTLFLALTASVGTIFAQSGTCGENLTWNLADSVLTISGTGAMADYSYAAKVPWYNYRTSIKSVIILDGITRIGNSAFSMCGRITSVTLPNSVSSIGEYAFSSTSITSITIPNGVSSIEESTFSSCSKLYTVIIPNSVTSIGERAFYDCRALTSINIPNGVTSIGSWAFYDCRALTSIYIPEGVTSIEQNTFLNCTSLNSITIPNSVTSIGSYAFKNCSGLTSIEIPNSVTNIGYDVFANCTGLTSVINHATEPQVINRKAFENVDRFTCRLYVPKESIEEYMVAIGWKKFAIIQAIGEILEPCVVAVGTCCDSPYDVIWRLDCDSVLTIRGTGPMKNYMYDAPWNNYNSSIRTIIIRDSVTSIGQNAFAYCRSLTSVTISNCVTSIGEEAFWGCDGLTSIEIPNSVTSIGNSAFENCISITSLTIPNSVSRIGSWAFYEVPNVMYSGNASGLPWGARSVNGFVDEYLVYNDSTTKTKLLACSAIKHGEITISNSVTSIGDDAFIGCRGLTSITIPNSVSSIGNYAFAYCSGLTSITNYATSPQSIGTNVVDSVDISTCTLYVTAQSVAAYQAADVWKDFGNILPIEGSNEEPTDSVYEVVYIDQAGLQLDFESVTLHLPEAPQIEGFTFLKWQVVAGDLENGIYIQAVYTANEPTNAPEVYTNPANSAQKLIRNGNVYILTSDKTYTVTGQKIK